MSDILVDASCPVVVGYPRDRNHEEAKQFAADPETGLLIPDVVLTEAIYDLQRLGGVGATVQFANLLVAEAPEFVSLTVTDFAHAVALIDKYRDAEFDSVDCCLTALAERLTITRICTFDRRDFATIRPKHADYFELLMVATRLDIVQASFSKALDPFQAQAATQFGVSQTKLNCLQAIRITVATSILVEWIKTGKQQAPDERADEIGEMIENMITLDQLL